MYTRLEFQNLVFPFVNSTFQEDENGIHDHSNEIYNLITAEPTNEVAPGIMDENEQINGSHCIKV